MKKQVNFVTMSASSAQQAAGQLRLAARGSDLLDLACALDELAAGGAATLMVELDSDVPGPPPAQGLACGELSVDPRMRRVYLAGREIVLTPKEFDILYFLMSNRGIVFTKEQIYHAVWAEEFLLSDSNIMAFIRKLRKKIEPDPDDPVYILTVWGVGYQFNDRI